MPNLTHIHSYTPDERTCDECGGHVYEVQTRPGGSWCKTSQWMFRSWSGARRIDGEPFDGPVYILGNREVYAGVTA